jgi:PKD domain
MQLTPSQLETARQRPQETNENLFIYQPSPVLKCRINNAAIAKGARTIAYNSVTLGSYTKVEAGMTVLIGSSDGASDVGRIRLKSITPAQIVVSENSDIKWQNGLYITVLKYWEVWPVFPRIIQNPSNIEDVIFYKDYDIPHTQQNNILGTFVQAGTSHGVLLDGGIGQAFFTASGSYNVAGSSLSYQWTFEGGTPSGSSNVTPGYVTYSTPGEYVTKLVVTAGNGAVDTTYRYVSVKNKIGEGANTPIVKWSRGDLSGSRSEGGYSVDITVWQEIDIMENSLVILKSDDWYNTYHGTLGGNQINSSDTFFVGYVEKDSIKYNAYNSSVSFTAVSITAIMKKATGFSISVESTQSAVTWFQLKDMDVHRAIYHYLRWHSTVLNVADFEFRGNDKKIQYFDADRGSLYDAIDNLLRGTLIGTLCSDRQGKLWGEIEPRAYPEPTGTFHPVMDITRRDWMGEPDIEERLYNDLSYTELGGIAYSGAITGTFSPLLSDAPGGTPAHMGAVDSLEGLALESQTQLNIMTGHVWANRNSPYPAMSINAPTMLKNLDIAPYEVVSVHVLPEDTAMNVDIQGIYIPTSMSWSPNSANRITLPSIELVQLVDGNPGDTVIIPPVNEIEYPNMNFSFPPFPSFLDIPALAIYSPTTIQNVLVSIKDQGIYYTLDFDSDYPTWYAMNVNLPDLSSTVTFEVGTTGKVFLQYGLQSLWVAPYPGGTWTKFWTSEYDSATYGPIGGLPNDPNSVWYGVAGAFDRTPILSGFGIDRRAEDSIIILGGFIEGVGSNTWLLSWKGSSSLPVRNGVTAISVNNQSGAQRLGFLTRTNAGWLFTFYQGSGNGTSAKISSDGITMGDLALGDAGNVVLHTQSIHSNDVATNLYHPFITKDDGTTWTQISGSPVRYGQANPDEFQSIITNADGTQILVGTSDVLVPPGLVYSLNNGASWATGTFITGTFNASTVWHLQDSAYVVGGYTPAVDGSTKILAIYDMGGSATGTTSVLDKTGNLKDYFTGTFYPTAIRHYYNYE